MSAARWIRTNDESRKYQLVGTRISIAATLAGDWILWDEDQVVVGERSGFIARGFDAPKLRQQGVQYALKNQRFKETP